MTTNFLIALRAEIADLEAEIRKDPRLVKLQQLRNLLPVYEPNGTGQQPQPKVKPDPIVETVQALTKEDRARDEFRRLCRQQGKVSRIELLQHLITKKIMGHEKNPMGNLAAYMTHWKDEFASDGNGIWWLREPSGSPKH